MIHLLTVNSPRSLAHVQWRLFIEIVLLGWAWLGLGHITYHHIKDRMKEWSKHKSENESNPSRMRNESW